MLLLIPCLVWRTLLRSRDTFREFRTTFWPIARQVFMLHIQPTTCLFGSLSVNVGALRLRRCFCPPWMNPRNGSTCSRILMNRSAVVACLNSRCALGDRLPFFFRMDRLSFVSPTVSSGNSCPVIHNPIWDNCVQWQYSLSQTSGPFWTSCLAFQ